MSSVRAKRARLLAAHVEQDGLCFYCDKPTWLPWDAPGDPKRMATREHLRRKCDGGTNALQNIAMACLECNGRREDCPPAEWIAARGGELPSDADGCVQFGSQETASTFDFAPRRLPRVKFKRRSI